MSVNTANAVFTVHNASLTPAVDYEVTVTAEIADEGYRYGRAARHCCLRRFPRNRRCPSV